MSKLMSEYELAEAELNFWRDFVYWWEARYGRAPEPRMTEALRAAETRYEHARRLLRIITQ